MKKYLVIGNPIEHSLSPRLHNYWLKKNKIKATYDKKKVNEDDIKGVIKKIKDGEIEGINVTVPFKKFVIPFLDQLTSLAGEAQSVNTIYKKGNQVIGDNTDVGGFELSLKHILSHGETMPTFSIAGKNVLILGAGGVVPSIILALKRLKVGEIFLCNRIKEKAEKLNVDHGGDLNILDWNELTLPNDLIGKESNKKIFIVINATSLGLKKDDDICQAFKIDTLKKNQELDLLLFYDLIYNPSETNFLFTARKLGYLTINGKMMFIYQARLAFKIWHNLLPAVDDETIKLLDV